MLTGPQGDVLRLMEPGMIEQIASGEVHGMPLGDSLHFVASIVMRRPIAMVVLSLTVPYRWCRWANIILAACFAAFDLVGLPTYGSAQGTALIAAGIALNLATVWHAST